MEDLCPSPELSSEGSEGPEGQCPVSCPPSSPPGATFNPTPTTERLPAPTHSPQSSLSHREDCSGPWNAEAHWPHLGGCRCCCCCYHLPATRDGPRDMVSPPRCRSVGMGCSAHVCGYTIYALALPRPRCLSVHSRTSSLYLLCFLFPTEGPGPPCRAPQQWLRTRAYHHHDF